MTQIEQLISKDYTITGTGRWKKTVEHDSLVIDTKNNTFFWNSKNLYGGPLEWFRLVKGYTGSVELPTGSELIHSEYKPEKLTTYPELVNAFWKNGLNHRGYWKDDRLIFDHTVDRFKLGYYNGWYTIPFVENGELQNIQLRRVKPDKRIKQWYKNSKVFLFNVDILEFLPRVIICESTTDAILLNQNGIPAVALSIGPIGWQPYLFKYFIKQKHIDIIMDNDSVGREGAKKVARSLGVYRTKIYTFDGFPEKYDILDFYKEGNTTKELMELVRNESKPAYQIA